ncbi:MAG: integrase family protein [Gammaproteobacteria bacterium]|nr:integrase family protein [Gammaproteobacteria bacterium]
MSTWVKLTKSVIEKIAPPVSGQTFYRDSVLTGFGIRCTATGVKSFIIETRINGKTKRYTLGKYPALTPEQARKMAKIELGKIAQGEDTARSRSKAKKQPITLQTAYDDYLNTRKNLKPKTLKDYHDMVTRFVGDWLNKPLLDITKDMVATRHTKIGKQSQSAANLTMRVLRAIFNHAIATYENDEGNALIAINPVLRLSQTRAWYKIKRRDTVIKRGQLQSWYNGLCQLADTPISSKRDTLLKDYLLLILLTGLRRREAASLTWQQIDFSERTMTITDTKNGHKHTLPLSEFLFDLLQKRQQWTTLLNHHSPYVFPATSQSGHIEEPRKGMAKVTKLSGVEFSVHDLRRTFITIAESLDISMYALKRLLNHATANDVTAGYIILDVERLREPMEKINRHIMELMGIKQPIST